MIQLYVKEKNAFIFGLLPENIRRMREGWPVFVKLRRIAPEGPDWTVSVSFNAEVAPKDAAEQGRHISICFSDGSLQKFIKRPIWDIPTVQAGAPFALTLLYVEDEDKFTADLMQSGATIEEFRDERGRPVN